MNKIKPKHPRPPKRRIVIYGGSFNPPHIGHMSVIEVILRHFKCDEIWVMASGDRADKKIGTSAKDRIKMLQIYSKELFKKPKIKIIISNFEIKRPILTTTYDTKLALEKKYPQHKFYFAVSSELLPDIQFKWVKGKELWKSANFLAVMRPGFKLQKKLPENVEFVGKDLIWIDVSSTAIKKILKDGHSGVPYLSPGVAAYIKKNGLYR